ncbi:unnamed protein product [Parnassius apollo]|uniref:(apollo) hypothetical protein n=1 Tax=Parnassius apollo TaxID=110799 RepID=A0A8S3XMA8_PARAO|nr:unnamed protein product [Parnassius apollo]
MEEIANMLKKMQDDITEQRKELKSLQENISKPIIENMNLKFKEIMTKNEELEEIINNQHNALEKMERQIRMKNIVLFGLEENEKSYEDLENNIIKLLNEHLNANCTLQDIESALKLGRKREKPRPIKITFCKLSLKIKILKTKKRLDCTNYYIKEDFTPHVLKIRKEL